MNCFKKWSLVTESADARVSVVAACVVAALVAGSPTQAAHKQAAPEVVQATATVQQNAWLRDMNAQIRAAIRERNYAGAVQIADLALTEVGQHEIGFFEIDGLLDTYNLQARAYQSLGLHLSAAFTLRRALDLVDDYTYTNVDRLLVQVRALADAWKFANQPDEADKAYRRALAFTGGLPGQMRLEHAVNLTNYARFLIDRLEFAAAEPLLVQAERHIADTAATPELAEQVNHLLQVAYLGLGKPDRALAYGWACVEAARRMHGIQSEKYVKELFAYAKMELRTGREASAAEHLALAQELAVRLNIDPRTLSQIAERISKLSPGAKRIASIRGRKGPHDIGDTSATAR